VFDRIFGKGRRAKHARRAELRGDLAQAAALFAEAGRLDEAARVMLLRGDAEPEPRSRLVHYTQAAATAPAGHEVQRIAARKRAMLVVALVGDGPLSAAVRQDLVAAARELEALGEQERAAVAFARAGDVESEARVLAQAGDVEKLEWVLGEQQDRERRDRARQHAAAEVETLAASGRRREAAIAAEASDDEALRARGRAIRAQRAAGPIVRAVLHGAPVAMVLGEEIVLGRTEGALQIASNAVSRRHLVIARRDGTIVVRDLGGRNGTLLRGLALAGEATVGEGVELKLGREVPIRLTPSASVAGGVDVDLAGATYVAPLGAASLGVGAWRLEVASDGWIELATDDAPPAYLGAVRLVPRATLLAGDAIASERGGEAVLRIAGV
jgi:hypothetical protein